jgi:hypothetical protein
LASSGQASVRVFLSPDSVSFPAELTQSAGAIPPLSELQAQLWVYRWLQHFHGNKLVRKDVCSSDDCTAPLLSDVKPDEGVIAPYELDYALHARGSYDFFSAKRGVDHESYAYQLALDMGAAPTFWHMVRKHGWKTVYTWAMGPNFNSKFRLVGPWANTRVAVPIMEGELFGVVKRSGGLFCEFPLLFLIPHPWLVVHVLTAGPSLRDVHAASVLLVRLHELDYYPVSGGVRSLIGRLDRCEGCLARIRRWETGQVGQGLNGLGLDGAQGGRVFLTCSTSSVPVLAGRGCYYGSLLKM